MGWEKEKKGQVKGNRSMGRRKRRGQAATGQSKADASKIQYNYLILIYGARNQP